MNDASGVEAELTKVPPVFDKMIRSFRRITEHCNTDVYYHRLRPYLFGFDGVVYEGVAAFEEKPMTFMGESGAQSTVIPAIKALIGLQHSKGGLSEDLLSMQAYMPKPHRTLLADIDSTAIRSFVERAGDPNLRDIYNLCLERIVDFRSLHLKMAHAFIAQKVKDPRGTGGTDFMEWLTKLRDETALRMIIKDKSLADIPSLAACRLDWATGGGIGGGGQHRTVTVGKIASGAKDRCVFVRRPTGPSFGIPVAWF